jgi:hypothetical protein
LISVVAPENNLMPCVLHISGKKFQPELTLKNVTFKPYRVYKAGEKIKIGKKRNSAYLDSGFSVDVGDRESWDLSNQIESAKIFIKKYFSELKKMSDAEDIRFDFGCEPRKSAEGTVIFCQSDYFAPDFLKLCAELKIGIEISIYGTDSKLNS